MHPVWRRASPLGADRFELRPVRNHPVFEVAPQRNRQTPGERHNSNTAHALARAGEASRKPLAQCALGLITQPAPSELHQQRARALVAGFRNALLDLAVPARVGRGRKPEATGHLAAVAKAPPAKQLFHQHPSAAYPDRTELRQSNNLRFGVGRHRLALLRSEEHTSELQSPCNLVCRLLLEKKKTKNSRFAHNRLDKDTRPSS